MLYIYAFIGSFLAGLSTVIGVIPVLFGKKISLKLQDILLGFSAGIMLSASFFSLILPALKISENLYNKPLNIVLVSFGILAGSLIFLFFDKLIPDEYFIKTYKEDSKRLKKMWLFILAITVHNFPEGMASSISFFSDLKVGISTATGIGIQNIPEGLAVALALYLNGFSKLKLFLITLLTGLVEPVGGLFSIIIFTFTSYILSFGLSLAAGAMLFVVSKEMIPETHKKGFETEATFGLIGGFIVMMILDNLLS